MRTSYVLPVRHGRRFAGRGLSLALLCALGVPASLPSAAHAQAARPAEKNLPVRVDQQVLAPESYILVSIDAKNASLATLIHQLMEQGHVSYTLGQNLMTAQAGNLILRKVPFPDALEAILQMSNVPVMFQLNQGIYRIVPREEANAPAQGVLGLPASPGALHSGLPPAPGVFGAPALKSADDAPVPVSGVSGADASLQPVTIIANNASLYQTLKQLFALTKSNYSLDPALDKARVTLTARKLPMRDVLTMLLKASGLPLTYRVEGGIYNIVEKQDAPQTVPPAP